MKDELGHPNWHSRRQAEQRPCWRMSWAPRGAPPQRGAGQGPAQGHSSGCPIRAGLGSSVASAVQLLFGPTRFPSLGNHRRTAGSVRVCWPPRRDGHVPLTPVWDLGLHMPWRRSSSGRCCVSALGRVASVDGATSFPSCP